MNRSSMPPCRWKEYILYSHGVGPVTCATENNGFAGGERDENLIDEELLETEIPLDDRIPDAAHEDAENDRPVYDEEGYRYDPGGE